ncbi:uncharacterized protein LOC141850506 [Brevipalpus obovatus]|uniref:uncharacterized protein LOC141850506 n=1 Tax=Brevipalpus obovatus TaxID=246614 RepID=UPI003D9E503F
MYHSTPSNSSSHDNVDKGLSSSESGELQRRRYSNQSLSANRNSSEALSSNSPSAPSTKPTSSSTTTKAQGMSTGSRKCSQEYSTPIEEISSNQQQQQQPQSQQNKSQTETENNNNNNNNNYRKSIRSFTLSTTSSKVAYHGIKSQAIKKIQHPLERSLAEFFIITVVFTLIAIVTGIPIVIILFILLIPAYLIRKLFRCRCHSLPPTMSDPTPIETYWMSNIQKNNHKQGFGTCVMYMDGGISTEQLRDVIMSRVVQKPEMSRFRSIVKYEGLLRTPVWNQLSFEQFSIDNQIIEDTVLHSRSELKRHLLHIQSINIPDSLPPWQIRRCFAPYLNQVILILRIHQSIIDGVGLARILIQYLADQSPPKTTTFIRTTQGTTAITGYFKPRFGGVNFTVNLFHAAIVGPLTFILWLIWSFTKRKANYLKGFKNSVLNVTIEGSQSLDNLSMVNNISSSCNRSSSSIKTYQSEYVPEKSIHWTQVDLTKVNRIKQVTRCCLNDVIMAAITGALRQCMSIHGQIFNPPEIGISLPVDIRSVNDTEGEVVGSHFVMLPSPLPTNIEGAIPRLWEIRHLTEEIKTSADPAIMYGAHFFLHHLMPTRMARFILNLVHRNSSVCLSNLQGPEQAVTIGTHRLHRILYTMSPPPPVSIVFNVISYNGQLELTVVTTSKLLPCARRIAKQFKCQIEMLSELLSKRRVPGEVRTRKAQQQNQQQQVARNSQFLLDAPFSEDPMFTQDLATKLNHVQLERYYMNEMLEAHPANRDDIEYRLEELKEEFTDLMKQLRRRKSMAEYGIHNIIINVEEDPMDDDMDGELRPVARRFSFGVPSRRSSVVSAISIPSSRFQVSPPHMSRRFVPSPSEPSSPSDAYIKEETV